MKTKNTDWITKRFHQPIDLKVINYNLKKKLLEKTSRLTSATIATSIWVTDCCVGWKQINKKNSNPLSMFNFCQNLRMLQVLPSQSVGHVHTFGAVQLPRTHSGLHVAVAQLAPV